MHDTDSSEGEDAERAHNGEKNDPVATAPIGDDSGHDSDKGAEREGRHGDDQEGDHPPLHLFDAQLTRTCGVDHVPSMDVAPKQECGGGMIAR